MNNLKDASTEEPFLFCGGQTRCTFKSAKVFCII